jgi:hypothetical protein
VIRLRGDKLIRELGQEVELIPLSETRFKVGNTSLMTEFVRRRLGRDADPGLRLQANAGSPDVQALTVRLLDHLDDVPLTR